MHRSNIATGAQAGGDLSPRSILPGIPLQGPHGPSQYAKLA